MIVTDLFITPLLFYAITTHHIFIHALQTNNYTLICHVIASNGVLFIYCDVTLLYCSEIIDFAILQDD